MLFGGWGGEGGGEVEGGDGEMRPFWWDVYGIQSYRVTFTTILTGYVSLYSGSM